MCEFAIIGYEVHGGGSCGGGHTRGIHSQLQKAPTTPVARPPLVTSASRPRLEKCMTTVAAPLRMAPPQASLSAIHRVMPEPLILMGSETLTLVGST